MLYPKLVKFTFCFPQMLNKEFRNLSPKNVSLFAFNIKIASLERIDQTKNRNSQWSNLGWAFGWWNNITGLCIVVNLWKSFLFFFRDSVDRLQPNCQNIRRFDRSFSSLWLKFTAEGTQFLSCSIVFEICGSWSSLVLIVVLAFRVICSFLGFLWLLSYELKLGFYFCFFLLNSNQL